MLYSQSRDKDTLQYKQGWGWGWGWGLLEAGSHLSDSALELGVLGLGLLVCLELLKEQPLDGVALTNQSQLPSEYEDESVFRVQWTGVQVEIEYNTRDE